eukprot:6086951-Pyramimonas_sp.AAC.1
MLPDEVVQCLAPLIPVLSPIRQAHGPYAVAGLARPLQPVHGLLRAWLDLVFCRGYVVVEQLFRA